MEEWPGMDPSDFDLIGANKRNREEDANQGFDGKLQRQLGP